MSDVVVLLSGGLDSSTLLHLLLAEKRSPIALSVHYAQKHSVELASARRVAAAAKVELREVELGFAAAQIFSGARSSQVGKNLAVPEGHYADETMKSTVVPNRNMILLALAGAYASSAGIGTVAYAAHAGDHPVYSDCRPDFIVSCALTLLLGANIVLEAPFVELSKAAIVRKGAELGVPFALTYSCYRGNLIHCGRCSTCVERREAFDLAGVADPTRYEDQTDFWRTVTKAKP